MITEKGMLSTEPSVVKPVVMRVENYDWNALTTELSNYGYAVMRKIINRGECAEIASLYSNKEYFRSRINMSRHGFGKGEYIISSIRSRISSMNCAPNSIPVSPPYLMNGTEKWDLTRNTRNGTLNFSKFATTPVSVGQRRFNSTTLRTTSIVCIRICMVTLFFQFR
jgi:hypothetical protein